MSKPGYHSGYLSLFLGIWTLINLIQAGFTELNEDEVYYWHAYSRQLDWGYFDHPPAIALMIRIGTALFPGELGVRLLTVLLSTGSFYLVWVLAGRPRALRELTFLFLLLAAQPFIEVYGFVATPDSPLLFFTALFFIMYRRFLRSSGWLNTLALGASMAALLYSKYHGILIIGFTVFSNLKLLRDPRFYAASIFGALLFLPHLIWQAAHEFPSLRYHLISRNNPPVLKDPITYLVNQLLIFNPFLILFMVQALWRKPPEEEASERGLERAYYSVIIGFWVFFLLTTLRGHVEPQWNAVMLFPLVLLLYRYNVFRERTRRLLIYLSAISLLLFGVLRGLISDPLHPDSLPLFHQRAWVYNLEKEVGDAPVLFIGFFRQAAYYNFYTGQPAYVITTTQNVRISQYELRDWEKALQNQRVALVNFNSWDCADCRETILDKKRATIKWADSLQVSQGVTFRVLSADSSWQAGVRQTLTVEVSNPYDHTIEMNTGNMPLRVMGLFLDGDHYWHQVPIKWSPEDDIILPGKSFITRMSFQAPAGLSEPLRFAIGIQTGDMPPVVQSQPTEIVMANGKSIE